MSSAALDRRIKVGAAPPLTLKNTLIERRWLKLPFNLGRQEESFLSPRNDALNTEFSAVLDIHNAMDVNDPTNVGSPGRMRERRHKC